MLKMNLAKNITVNNHAAGETSEGMDIDALLAEYTALKAEETSFEQSQMQIATALFSFIAAIIGLNFFFQESNNIKTESSQYMILGFCPLLICFFGILWMYQLYCQMRFGAYLYHLETDINECYKDHKRKIYFEHWLIRQEPQTGFFQRTSRLYGYITLGTWLLSPWLLIFFADGFFPTWNILEFYRTNLLLGIFLGLVLAVYYIVQLFYLKAILSLKNKDNLEAPRISED